MTEENKTAKTFVTYRGRKMIAGWPEKIEKAQTITHYGIGGENFQRIPYGKETYPYTSNSCKDCSAFKGELHVPTCDTESCPKCGGQAIGCDCDPKAQITQLH